MEQQENISRRDALKRMAKTAMVVAVASMLPSENLLASNTNSGSEYYNYSNYVDKCYNDYTNYHNYSNHADYYNYSNYRDYSNYHNYSNYNDAVK